MQAEYLLSSSTPFCIFTQKAASLLQGGFLLKGTDLALGVAIPVHSHVAMNMVVTDYVPKAIRGKASASLPLVP